MQKLMLLGDEAIAQAGIDAACRGYMPIRAPHPPRSRSMSCIRRKRGPRRPCCLGANEKTAMEAALGMSYAGKRSMVCMKHSGLMWPLMLL